MLGNSSFGDFRCILKLLTQTYKLSAKKLWLTVYFADDEAYNFWQLFDNMFNNPIK